MLLSPEEPVVCQSIEQIKETLWEDHSVLKGQLLDDYIYIHESDCNIGQSNNPNSYYEDVLF